MTEMIQRLNDYAAGAARASERQAQSLAKQLRELENEIGLAHAAAERLGGYEPDIAGRLQCPDCWIVRGVQSPLQPVANDMESNVFRCPVCAHEFSA